MYCPKCNSAKVRAGITIILTIILISTICLVISVAYGEDLWRKEEFVDEFNDPTGNYYMVGGPFEVISKSSNQITSSSGFANIYVLRGDPGLYGYKDGLSAGFASDILLIRVSGNGKYWFTTYKDVALDSVIAKSVQGETISLWARENEGYISITGADNIKEMNEARNTGCAYSKVPIMLLMEEGTVKFSIQDGNDSFLITVPTNGFKDIYNEIRTDIH